ncbi:MAG: hypothetical protein HFI98_11330 [Lachnospiraceae bacterium]|nr:hypothetical protein [Lachnospiraceae bacterium]MCI9335310.1 hypothetical protein [Lachnospiraceae bacterium]
MEKFLKKYYQFDDYQVALLQFIGKTFLSESSKLLIMGIIFRDRLDLYAVAITVMIFLRTATGGLHCKRYVSCLLASFTYVFLSIRILPLIPVNKVFQLILLFICMLSTYFVGPVTSTVHLPLKDGLVKRVKVQAFLFIFFFIVLTYIVPENPYITVGFWVIILHTLQLGAARIIKKGDPYEREIVEAE